MSAIRTAAVLRVATAFAQFRASVQGTITDPTCAVVPKSTVTLTSNLAPIWFGSAPAHADNGRFFGRADSGLAGRVVELWTRFSF